MINRFYSLFFLVSLSVLFWRCAEDGPTRPSQLWNKEDTQQIQFNPEGLPVLSVQNYYGGMFIYGHTQKDQIKVTATRKVQTDNRENLDTMLNSINIPVTQRDDTVYVQVTAPVAKRHEGYACGLNIFIPYAMPVHVSYAKSPIITNELDSLVYVRRAQSRVRLERHRGSADIQALSHINMEFYSLWPHTFVTAVTDSGDVNIVIPGNASATILAQSFYHPIELIDIQLDTYLRSYYTAEGIVGNGDTPITLKTTYGIIRIKAD